MIAAGRVAPSLTRFDEDFRRKLQALTLVAKRTRGGNVRAERRSKRVGSGIELADHREYAPGDDVRSLDWNLYARLDRPFVRLREEEEDLTLAILVDTSASMITGAPPKLELAVRVAAALALVGLTGLGRVGVSLIGARVNAALPPARGSAVAARVLALLDGARAGGRTDLAAAVGEGQAAAGAGLARRRGLVVLLSDLLDPAGCLPVLNRLRSARQEIVVVQLMASDDMTVPFDGDVALEDVETGEIRAMTITPAVRRAHALRYQALLHAVAAVCRKRSVPCFQVASHVPFEDVVLRILRSGGVLR